MASVGLGLPTWSDKLLQEVMRSILDAYFEPQFSDYAHGFRPHRGCHTALSVIQRWRGVNWFIEGDIERLGELLRPVLQIGPHPGAAVPGTQSRVLGAPQVQTTPSSSTARSVRCGEGLDAVDYGEMLSSKSTGIPRCPLKTPICRIESRWMPLKNSGAAPETLPSSHRGHLRQVPLLFVPPLWHVPRPKVA
jgi:hypothetical protein